mgnify:CR=1 FL=1
MADGRIIDQGTHPELLAAQGPYREMWDLQRKERERRDANLSVEAV